MPEFTNDWFGQTAFKLWNKLLTDFKVKRYLEIGSYEGASTCFMIEHMDAPAELVCIDPWARTEEHFGDMEAVFARFKANVSECVKEQEAQEYTLNVMRTTSDIGLGALRAAGVKDYFDMIYIDGSHTPWDVMADACGAWPMLRIGGILVFDDYTWPLGEPPAIKHSIDNWCEAYMDHLKILSLGSQFVVQKIGKRNG